MFFNNMTLQNEKRILVENQQMISLNYISLDIMIYRTDEDSLILKEYFSDTDPDLHAEITVDEQNITIRHGKQKFLSLIRGYIELFIPNKYYGTLNVLTISGDMKARCKLSLDELTISSTSGDIELDDVTAGSAVISTVSGDMDVIMLRANSNIHTTSGSIHIACAVGDGILSSISGDINVCYQTVLGDIKASNTSGRIRINVPHTHSFLLHAHSVSGGIRVGFPTDHITGSKHSLAGKVGENPRSSISLSTVSGRVELLPEYSDG